MSKPLQETNTNTVNSWLKPATCKPSTSSSLKRIHEEVTQDEGLQASAAHRDESDDDEPIEYSPSLNCNKVRTKIQQLIDSGEMKVTHFQRELGINSNSYGRFMKLKGPWTGIDNQTYHAAYKFFKKSDAQGANTAAKKRKSNDGTATKGAKATGDPAAFDVSGISLDGEMNDLIQIYDTPAEIRKKISAHLPKEGITAAAFCRALGDQFHPSRKIQSAQLQAFRKYSGPVQGNQSSVFYAAYVYFEKLRIKEEKRKSKHRQEMEKIHGGREGLLTDRPLDRGIVHASERATVDQYGEFIVSGRGR